MKTLYNIYEGLLDTDFSEEGIDNKSNSIKTEYTNGILEQIFGEKYNNMCKYDVKTNTIHVLNQESNMHIRSRAGKILLKIDLNSRSETDSVYSEGIELSDFLKTGIKIDCNFRIYDLHEVITVLPDVSKIPVSGRNHRLTIYSPSSMRKDSLKKFLNKKTAFNTLFIEGYDIRTTSLSSITTYDNIIVEMTIMRSKRVAPDISNLECKNLIISNMQIFELDSSEWYDSLYKKIITSNPRCKNIYADEDKYYPNSDYAIVINSKMNNIILDGDAVKYIKVNPRDVYTKL